MSTTPTLAEIMEMINHEVNKEPNTELKGYEINRPAYAYRFDNPGIEFQYSGFAIVINPNGTWHFKDTAD